MIGITQTHPNKGCFITFQQPLSVCLRDKLGEVKIPLEELMDLDHITIDEKYQFCKWKNIYVN